MKMALGGLLALGLVGGWSATARAQGHGSAAASPRVTVPAGFGAEPHAAESVRVIIAGPKKDPLSARLEKELVLLGFTPVKSDTPCDKASVASAASEASAAAALCSDGRRVAVWTSDPNQRDTLELRDTVAPDGAARDDVAMRAAEVMRANVEYREAEPPPPPPKPKARPLQLGGWEGFDDPDHPRPEPPGRDLPLTNTFSFAFGPAMLIGAETATTTLSGRISVGVHRRFSLTGRLDFPVSTSALESTTSPQLAMQSGLVGAGIELPLMEPSSRVIPRISANGGGVWVRAVQTAGGGTADGAFTSFATSTQTEVAAAAWVDAALSVGLYGPIRMAGELTFGSAFGRLVVLDESGTPVSHFGAPFGALALRMEVAIQ